MLKTSSIPFMPTLLTKRPRGRPRTSAGWSSITVRVPTPTKQAWDALPAERRYELREAFKRAIEAAVT